MYVETKALGRGKNMPKPIVMNVIGIIRQALPECIPQGYVVISFLEKRSMLPRHFNSMIMKTDRHKR